MSEAVARWLAVCSALAGETWWLQFVGYVPGLVGLVLAVRGARCSATGVPALLALLWLWTAILTAAAAAHERRLPDLLCATALLAQGLLFLRQVWRPTLAFGLRSAPASWAGVGLASYALVGHPAVVLAQGQLPPQASALGLTPGCLVVYTVGVLLLAWPHIPRSLLALPLLIGVAGPIWLASTQPAGVAMAVGGVAGASLILIWPRYSGPRYAGPRAGSPRESGPATPERGWSLDLTDEPCPTEPSHPSANRTPTNRRR